MIHIRACWLANGSIRAARAEKRARIKEEARKRRAELIEAIADKYRKQGSECPPWWVTIN